MTILVTAFASILTGCGATCTTIGWSNTLVVRVDGSADVVAAVEVCDDRGCSSEPSRDGVSGFSPPEVTTDGWVFHLADMSLPDRVVVRALDAGHRVVHASEVEPEWERIGGSEQCGGPEKATITLELGWRATTWRRATPAEPSSATGQWNARRSEPAGGRIG